MEKQKVTVYVGGKSYTLLTSDPESRLERVAAYADRTLRETAAAAHLQLQLAAPLALISLSDELIKAQDENTRLRRQLRGLEKEG